MEATIVAQVSTELSLRVSEMFGQSHSSFAGKINPFLR